MIASPLFDTRLHVEAPSLTVDASQHGDDLTAAGDLLAVLGFALEHAHDITVDYPVLGVVVVDEACDSHAVSLTSCLLVLALESRRRTLASVLLEFNLADANLLGRNLDALVFASELEALFERQFTRRSHLLENFRR